MTVDIEEVTDLIVEVLESNGFSTDDEAVYLKIQNLARYVVKNNSTDDEDDESEPDNELELFGDMNDFSDEDEEQ